MLKFVSKARFEALKRQAKRLVRSRSSLSHSQALDELARAEGFDNWSLLARRVDGNDAAPARSAPNVTRSSTSGGHVFTLSGCILTVDPKGRWQTEERVEAKYPSSRYEKVAGVPKRFFYRGARGEQRSILSRIAKAKRLISFMDRTSLRASRAWTSMLGRDHRLPAGFDHTYVWRDDQDRFILTTEPYIGADQDMRVGESCRAFGWKWLALPKGQGIWNPCGGGCPVDCTKHTRMYLIAPPKRGGDLAAITRTLR